MKKSCPSVLSEAVLVFVLSEAVLVLERSEVLVAY